jgi:hypothetical protein
LAPREYNLSIPNRFNISFSNSLLDKIPNK